jgi:hypothetical protein
MLGGAGRGAAIASTGGDHVREAGALERRRRAAVDPDQAVDAFGGDLDERAIPLKPASLTSTASSDSLWIDEVMASMPPSSGRSAMRTRAETPCWSHRRWASASRTIDDQPQRQGVPGPASIGTDFGDSSRRPSP